MSCAVAVVMVNDPASAMLAINFLIMSSVELVELP
jgi:hypothetical protein